MSDGGEPCDPFHVCSPDIVSALAADKQDVESGLGLFPPRLSSTLLPSPLSPVHTGLLRRKRHFELQTTPRKQLGKTGKLMTELPLCQAGVRRREESVFTNDMICKWSGGGEALRTRWSPRRSVCSSGIR